MRDFFETDDLFTNFDVLLFGILFPATIADHLPYFGKRGRRTRTLSDLIERIKVSTHRAVLQHATRTGWHRDLLEYRSRNSPGWSVEDIYRWRAHRYLPVFEAIAALIQAFFDRELRRDLNLLECEPFDFDYERATFDRYPNLNGPEDTVSCHTWRFDPCGVVDERQAYWIMPIIRENGPRARIGRQIRSRGRRLSPQELRAYGINPRYVVGETFIRALLPAYRHRPIHACNILLLRNYDDMWAAHRARLNKIA